MNKHRQPQKILLSPAFILCLFLLLLNDFFLKSYFHNALTGKLSDFAGLFVFPLFWAALFPKRKLFVFAATAVFFVFWKSPYSDSLIEFWNSLPLFRIERAVDYTDLAALTVLPLAWIYSDKREKRETFASSAFSRKFASTLVAFISLFAFTATQQAPQTMEMEEFGQTYKFQTSSMEISKKLQEFETDNFSQTKDVGIKSAAFNIRLHEKVCKGFPEAYFSVSRGERAEITLSRIMYPCDDKLPGQREKLQKMFESEIIAFLNKQ